MGKYKVGSKVIVRIDDENSIKGIVIKIFEGVDMAIVDFQDNDIRKVPFSEMELDLESEAKTVDEIGITITLESFRKVVHEICLEEAGSDASLLFKLGMITTRLEDVLFFDR